MLQGAKDQPDVQPKEPGRSWQWRAKRDPYEQKLTSASVMESESENRHHRTCFQRIRPKPETWPVTRPEWNKPTSMMTSSPTSTVSAPMTGNLLVPRLSSKQAFATGDHVERNYNCELSIAGPKQFEIIQIHLYDTCDITRIIRDYSMVSKNFLL